MRKGESLRNYVKRDLPDNGSFIFWDFQWEKPVHEYGGYDTPLKAGAKRYGNENLVVKVNYRDNNHNWNGGILKARSAYIHESPSLNSPSNKELVSQYTKGGIIQYTIPMD